MIIAGHQVDDAMFSYIASNADADTVKLLLKAEPSLTFDKSFAITQIECRRGARSKIPTLLQDSHFLFPKAISAEQCTHQLVAQFHARQVGTISHLLDMTMGLGVDTFHFAQCASRVTAIELDAEIAAVGQFNFSRLAPNVNVVNADSVEYLNKLDSDTRFDAIFIDPARRGDSGKRLYGLADCMPNVLELLPAIKRHTPLLYIKASPMLDVTRSIHDLGPYLTHVWAVSIKNECKELFFKLDFNAQPQHVELCALNHDNSWNEFHAHLFPTAATVTFATPATGDYLLEPNASVMKLGCFNSLIQQFRVNPIATNSHLFISPGPLPSFPGRQFSILQVIPFKNKEIKQLASQHRQLNITTRNFRLTPDQLKKRLGVNDGGDLYLLATTLACGQQTLLLCRKT